MFFKERTGQEGILATSRRKIKQAGRLLMALAVGGCLWGQGEVGCAGTYYYFNKQTSNNTVIFDENGNLSSSTSTPRTGNNSDYEGIKVRAGDVDYQSSTSEASNNVLTINGGIYREIYGGYSVYGTAMNNTINFNNGEATGQITGGIGGSLSGTINNTVNINGGVVKTVNSNNVNISNGSVELVSGDTINISGGEAKSITVGQHLSTDNAVAHIIYTPGELNIYGSPVLSILRGTSYTSTVDTINIHAKNLTASSIENFENVNFYLSPDITNGDTMITVQTANLDGANVQAVVEGGTSLTSGDSVTLLKAINNLSTNNTTYTGTLSEGVSLDYDLTVEKADDTSIVARVGSASPSPTNPTDSGSSSNSGSGGGMVSSSGSSALKEQTNVLPAPLLSNSVLSLQGTDRLLEWLPPEDPVVGEDTGEGKDDSKENVAKAESPNEFQIFANTGFSNLRTKIGGNSYMDNHSAGFDLGAARTLENSRGRLVFAPIVDYGSGSYDVYNDGRHGSGNSKYWAAGMIARQMNKDGFYYEASFRAGRAMVDFASDDFTQGGVPTRVTYDASAPCFAGHVRVGKIYQFGPRNQLHLYGIYSHNHQNGMTATLSTGETYHFSAVDSGRLRIGGRLSWQKSNTQKFYSGIAYQYEFSNGATGSYKGYSTNSSSIHGSSAMIELGWQIKPSQKSPWMVDVNAAGWVGHQKGFTIQAKLMKSF